MIRAFSIVFFSIALLGVSIQASAAQSIREALEKFTAEGRTLPPSARYVLDKKGDPVADTTTTCNYDTHICTCVSDNDESECGPVLSTLCNDSTGWSNGGVGENCPSPPPVE